MMKALIVALLLASTASADWSATIACELAVESLVESSTKVPRSECTVCNGTGRVKAGDGRTVVWRDCSNCFPDAGEQPEQPERRELRILFFTADWCLPCQRQKKQIFPAMESAGWTFGDIEGTGHIRTVDYDTHPELVKQYDIKSVPTFVVVDQHGTEFSRHSGVLDIYQIRKLWDDATDQPRPDPEDTNQASAVDPDGPG